jgi:hypothetical protein
MAAQCMQSATAIRSVSPSVSGTLANREVNPIHALNDNANSSPRKEGLGPVGHILVTDDGLLKSFDR